MDLRGRLRHVVHKVRTDGASPARQGWAVAIGFFVGCTPVYGLHTLMAVAAARVFRLNFLTVLLAAQVTYPPLAPFAYLLMVQVGSWLRRGGFYVLSLDEIRLMGAQAFLRAFLADLLVGSTVVGVVVGGALGLFVFATLARRARGLDPRREALVERVALRQLDAGLLAWEIARWRLRRDPLIEALLDGSLGGALDVPAPVVVAAGSPAALAAQLLVEAADPDPEGPLPARWLPRGAALHAVLLEERPRARARLQVALADRPALALAAAAPLAQAELPERADLVLFLDALHRLGPDAQRALLARVAAILDPAHGVLVLREIDAEGGLAARAAALGARLLAWAGGHRGLRIHRRSRAAWAELCREVGLEPVPAPASAAPVVGRGAFVLVARPAARAADQRRTTPTTLGTGAPIPPATSPDS